MQPALSCPPRGDYARLIHGELPPSDVERLSQHLAGCSSCTAMVQTLVSEDTLLSAIGDATVDAPNGAKVPADLTRRLLALAAQAPGERSCRDAPSLAPPQAADEIGRLAHYRVLKVLGEGGMGVVFLAEDMRLGRTVALKTMKPEIAANLRHRQRFLREARAAAKVEHDHIVPIYDVGEDNGVPWLAMPFLKGQSLNELLKQRKVLTPVQAVRLGAQVARGLAAAHAAGLIHRDVKPDNIWVEPEHGGRARLLDFGLARALADDVHLTQSGTILGTPAYMAPEQAGGEPVDARTDLFSLGVVLYRICTGLLPFKGDNTMALLNALATQEPRRAAELNPALSPELDELIGQLLAKDPAQRPTSAQAVADRLQAIERRLAASTPAEPACQGPVPPVTPIDATVDETARFVQSPPRKRTTSFSKPFRRRLVAAAAVALLVLGSLAYFFGGTVLRFATNKGEVVIATDDRDIEVSIRDQAGTIIDRGSKREYTVQAGTEHTVEVTVKDTTGEVTKFATKKFTVSRGGKEVLRVELQLARAKVAPKPGEPRPGKSPVLAGDPDRRAAEYVLSIGGTIRINDQEGDIRAAAELPKEPFRLTFVSLRDNKQVTDVGLAHFKDCKNLTSLGLYNTRVSDTGLAHFKDCKNLTHFDLGFTRVSDAGLAHFKDCKNLTYLSLGGTQVSDTGLALFKDCKNLTHLDLYDTRVSDAGLALFKDCKNLTYLGLHGTRVSDTGLAYFKDCKNLTLLQLGGTRVTDAGLVHLKDCKTLKNLHLGSTRVSDTGLAYFKDCKNLTYLDLYDTRVSDAGLAHFKDCKNLTNLNLDGTWVTDTGLEVLADLPNLQELYLQDCRISRYGYEQLKASFPKAKIDWSEPNRRAAEQVLALGGTVDIAAPGKEARPVKPGDPLPTRFFQVRRVVLKDVKKPLGELPATLALLSFAETDRLEAIDLTGTPLPETMRGPGLANLARQAELAVLSLSGTGLTDDDLARLPKLPRLGKLVLDDNLIRGQGLVPLQEQPELVELSLARTGLSDLTVKQVAGLKRLKRLSLAGTGLSDAGIRHLEGLTDLQELDLSGTKASVAGIAALQTALPKCKILSGHAAK